MIIPWQLKHSKWKTLPNADAVIILPNIIVLLQPPHIFDCGILNPNNVIGVDDDDDCDGDGDGDDDTVEGFDDDDDDKVDGLLCAFDSSSCNDNANAKSLSSPL